MKGTMIIAAILGALGCGIVIGVAGVSYYLAYKVYSRS